MKYEESRRESARCITQYSECLSAEDDEVIRSICGFETQKPRLGALAFVMGNSGITLCIST